MDNEGPWGGGPPSRLPDLTQTAKYVDHPDQVGMVVDELELRRAQAEAEKRKLQVAYAASEEARSRCGELPLEAMGHVYQAGLHLTCAGGPWGQYSAMIVGWVGPGPGSTMTSEEITR